MIYKSKKLDEAIAERIRTGLLKDLNKTVHSVLKVESEYDAGMIVQMMAERFLGHTIPDITFGFYHRRAYIWHKSLSEVELILKQVSYRGKKPLARKFLLRRAERLFKELEMVWDLVLSDWNYKGAEASIRHEIAPTRRGPWACKQDIVSWMERVHYSTRSAYTVKNAAAIWADKELWYKPGFDDSIIKEIWDLTIAREVSEA